MKSAKKAVKLSVSMLSLIQSRELCENVQRWKEYELCAMKWGKQQVLFRVFYVSWDNVSPLCNPKDCRPPGCSVHGILQTRILEWTAMPSSRGSSWPRDGTRVSSVSCIAGGFFPLSHQISPYIMIRILNRSFSKKKKRCEISKSCLTLCSPMDYSLSGSSVHGIFQARVLEWVAISLIIFQMANQFS